MTNKVKRRRDEEIVSESDSNEEYQDNSENGSEDQHETTHQAQVRIKKQMIKRLKEDIKSRKVEDIDDEVRKTLEEEALDKQGKIIKDMSKSCHIPESEKIKLYKNKNEITCFTYSESGQFIFTGNSIGDIIKWDVKTGDCLGEVKGGRRNSKHNYHRSRVTAIASSGDYLATGDLEQKIFIWNLDLTYLKTLTKHRSEITSLVFRRNSDQLFSGDKKGIILVWNMVLMNTIEELLGHTSGITDLDSNLANNVISCSDIGDPCVKLWKLDNESMVSYTLPKKQFELSLECITMLNERFFVAGSSTNNLYLWDGVNKKSPIDMVKGAHDMPEDPELVTSKEVYVVSIAALRHTNVFASGSNMSQVKLWHAATNKNATRDNLGIVLLFVVPGVQGCVNGLQFGPGSSGDLAVAVSHQHKRHRMQERCPHTKSFILVYSLFNK